MLIVRAPVRISFVGGGTDLPEFYTQTPGRVISTAIDKYIYVTINQPPLVRNVSVRYSTAEDVNHPSELKNDRVREALLHFKIHNNIDVGTFSDVPVKTGLGSSSSFSVALIKALLLAQGKKADKKEVAELASHLEINLLKEPIGKQDQYAAAFGGLNIFQFNPDHSVDIEPIHIDYKRRFDFESHLHIFYTGITRLASSVLNEQRANIQSKMDILKKMADSVSNFRDRLHAGDFKSMGNILHDGWTMKRTLASNVSNSLIDELYNAGMNAGAWGGKVLGAGGGGCILFLAQPELKINIKEAVTKIAAQNGLRDFAEIPVRFVQSGVEVLVNHDRGKYGNNS